jgi:hypothetical protein
MLRVKRVMIIRDLCKMFNFVRILVDYQLIYRRGLKFGSFTTSTPLYKINKRASKPTSERAEGIDMEKR